MAIFARRITAEIRHETRESQPLLSPHLSDLHQSFIAVAEIARARGKRTCSAVLLSALALLALGADLPEGGRIVAGSGAIASNGTTMTVTQTSERLVADWQSFGIGPRNAVDFVQPSSSSVALNRVLGSDVSGIQGQLSANGQVFLINPNGVLFTPTAQVDVGGLVASTRNISNEDFLAGRYRFSGDSDAAVRNEGRVNVGAGGTAALIAARIENTGSIEAPRGNVLMGAGERVTPSTPAPSPVPGWGALRRRTSRAGRRCCLEKPGWCATVG